MGHSWSQIRQQIHRTERRRVRREQTPGTSAVRPISPAMSHYYAFLGGLAFSLMGAVITLIGNYIVTVWLLHLSFE